MLRHPVFSGIQARLLTLSLFIGSIWGVSLFCLSLSWQQSLGIEPRTLLGLLGLVTAPWAHASLGHLLSNTAPLVVLGYLAMIPKKEGFVAAVVCSTVFAGAAAWLLGAPGSVHIGASGVVFGLFGFVVARGFYARRVIDLLVAVPATSFYGFSMALGALPIYPGVSWQSHLGGLLGGVLAAKVFATRV